MPERDKRSFFGVVTEINTHGKGDHKRHSRSPDFIGDEITLDGKHTFFFPSIFENEFGIGRRIFMDFEAWPNPQFPRVSIHIFKSDSEMRKECDGTVNGDDICYVTSYTILKEFVPFS
jgi:hypothetical protein